MPVRQAAILVGGLGTRLGTLTAAIPKPLLPCGDRPFLAWLLRELTRFGIEEVLLLTGHLGSVVEDAVPALTAGLPKPIHVTCAREPQRAGTGGALFHARQRLAERFLLCNGDSWFDFNMSRLLADAAQATDNVIGHVALSRVANASRYGVVETEGDRIVAFHERLESERPGLINAGIYVLDRGVLDKASPECSLERDIMPDLAASGLLRGTVGHGYFIDIGIPADLGRAREELAQRARRAALILDGTALADWTGPSDASAALTAIQAASDVGHHVFLLSEQPETRGTPVGRLIALIRENGGTVDDIACRVSPSGMPRLFSDVLTDLVLRWQLDVGRCLLVSDRPSDRAVAAGAGMSTRRLADGAPIGFIAT